MSPLLHGPARTYYTRHHLGISPRSNIKAEYRHTPACSRPPFSRCMHAPHSLSSEMSVSLPPKPRPAQQSMTFPGPLVHISKTCTVVAESRAESRPSTSQLSRVQFARSRVDAACTHTPRSAWIRVRRRGSGRR